jgi:uncharacterized protein
VSRSFFVAFAAVILMLFFIPGGLAYQMWTEMVAMTDGTHLATDVYIPDSGTEPWPTVLVRTVYNKTGGSGMTYVTDYGFALVVQDCRGRFESEGEDGIFFDDGWEGNRDGYDTVEWIASQSWSDGKIGTHGGSALGIVQILMAGAVPPHLTCQYIFVAASNLYSQAMFQGGGFRKAMIEGWLAGQGSLFRLPEIEAHPDYGPFWEPVNAETREPLIQAPGVHLGGWYDIFTQGTINAFTGRQYNGGDGARDKQILIIGPWTHGGFYTYVQGQLTYPAGSKCSDQFSDHLSRWLLYWMKDEQTGVLDDDPVNYYVMGDVDDPQARGNEWRSGDVWPVPANKYALYLHAGGELNWLPPAVSPASRTFVYDPSNPVPTLGGSNLCIPAGPYDQRSIENRSDVLVYETDILSDPVEIVGRIFCRLYLSTDVPDTDLTVKLTDVYPDGRSMLVMDGILRVRHRLGLDREDFMTPDVVELCEVDLWSTAMAFNTGHRIRVAVSSSNDPRFDPNPNTGHPFRADEEQQPATNTIHSSFIHPSHLLLPVTFPEFTPTPIPTPTSKPPERGVTIDIPSAFIHPGDPFYITGYLSNPEPVTMTDVPTFFMLDVLGEYFFWPGWVHYHPPEKTQMDYQILDVPFGTSRVDVIPEFIWPDTGTGHVDGIGIFGVMLNGQMTSVLGNIGYASWGYGP